MLSSFKLSSPRRIGNISKIPSFSHYLSSDNEDPTFAPLIHSHSENMDSPNQNIEGQALNKTRDTATKIRQKIKRLTKSKLNSAYKKIVVSEEEQTFIQNRKNRLKIHRNLQFSVFSQENQPHCLNKTDIVISKESESPVATTLSQQLYQIVIHSHDKSKKSVSSYSECTQLNKQKRQDHFHQLANNDNLKKNINDRKRISVEVLHEKNILQRYQVSCDSIPSYRSSKSKSQSTSKKQKMPIIKSSSVRPHKQYRSHPYLDRQSGRNSWHQIQAQRKKNNVSMLDNKRNSAQIKTDFSLSSEMKKKLVKGQSNTALNRLSNEDKSSEKQLKRNKEQPRKSRFKNNSGYFSIYQVITGAREEAQKK